MRAHLSYFNRMNKNSIIVACLLLLSLFIINATADEAGVSGFEFLNIQPGALPVSLAGAYTAGSGDAYSFAYNPAGLAGIKGRTFCFDYLHYVLDIQRGMIGYAMPAPGKGGKSFVYGAYLNYLNAGTFNITDEDGNQLGNFTAGFYELGMSVAKDIPATTFGAPIQLGATFKGLMEQVSEQNWSAVAFDVGAQYLVRGGRVRFGASAKNIGITTKELDSFPLPQVYSLGMSLTSRNWQNARFYTDFNYPVYGESSLRTGLDLKLDRDVFLRLGYRFLFSEIEHWYNKIADVKEDQAYERSDMNNWSVGFGTRFAKVYTLDIAVQKTTLQTMPLISATVQYAWR